MNPITAFIVPCVFLYAYLILSSIEFGASLFVLFPKLLEDDQLLKKYLNPVFETTNVFLVFFIVSLMTFFPGANLAFSALISVLFWALAVLGIRMACLLYIFFAEANNQWVHLLFLLSSFFAPAILSLAYVYMLTGAVGPVISWLLLFLVGTVWSSIVMIASSFFGLLQNQANPALSILLRISTVVFFISAICFILSCPPYIFGNTLAMYVIGLLVVAMLGFQYEDRLAFARGRFLMSCGCVGVLFFGLMTLHLPYIIYPNFTVYNSLTDPNAFHLLSLAFFAGLVIILPGLFWLYALFIQPNKS